MENCEVWKIVFKNVRGKYKNRKFWIYMEKIEKYEKENMEIHGKKGNFGNTWKN